MATIYDVARRAGVGIGTVSRAINNSPRISPATKDRVLAAVRELRYQPHALAQGLARKRTNMIGIILPVFTGYFYLELLKGIQYALSRHKLDLLLYSVDQTGKADAFLSRVLHEKRVDGVLLISLQISETSASSFKQTGFPIVLVDSHCEDIDSFTVENRNGAYQATRHLISLGHRRIGMIDAQLRSVPAKIRLDGYRQALHDAGLAFDPRCLVISDEDGEKDGFNRESGYHSMLKLLSMKENRPTAVFISSDIQAAGAMQAVRETGLRIPQDIALIGFDDIELAEYLGLSTMHQPLFEMGKQAVERLTARIEETDLEVMHRSFCTRLVVRSSCGG